MRDPSGISHRQTPERKPPVARRVFVPCAPLELKSFARIDWALRAILKEVKKNHGKYPHSERAPNIREVLLRASLSTRYLERQNGSTYREALKGRYKEKIKRVLRRIKSGRYVTSSIRPLGGEERESSSSFLKLQEQLRTLKERWVKAELEFIDAQVRLQSLEEEIQELNKEKSRLRDLLAASNVHILQRDPEV